MVQSCLTLKPCVKCGAWVGWDEAPNPHCIPSCDAQEERLTRRGGVMSECKGYQPEPIDTKPVPPKGGSRTVPLLDLEWKTPDRAARIRELAERMLLADLSSPNGNGGYLRNRENAMADLEEEAKHWYWNATVLSDILDRLEAEERAKEADRD